MGRGRNIKRDGYSVREEDSEWGSNSEMGRNSERGIIMRGQQW